MDFYTINNFDGYKIIKPEGIDIDRMVKSMKVLSKTSSFKTLEDIADMSIIFLDNKLKFVNNEGLEFVHESKNLNFALAKANQIFQIQDEDKTIHFCEIKQNLLRHADNRQTLNAMTSPNHIDVSSLSQSEKKAYDWLEQGQFGISSGTMCSVLFPGLKYHNKLVSMSHQSHPHDNSDFVRCMKFIAAVPEAKDRLEQMKSVSPEWENLINHWQEIEQLIKVNNQDGAYELIRNCVSSQIYKKPKM